MSEKEHNITHRDGKFNIKVSGKPNVTVGDGQQIVQSFTVEAKADDETGVDTGAENNDESNSGAGKPIVIREGQGIVFGENNTVIKIKK